MTAAAQTRPPANHQEFVSLPFALPSSSSTQSQIIAQYQTRVLRLGDVFFVPSASIAASNSTYWVLTLTDGTNTLASYSTKTTGGQGALTGGTPVRFVLASGGAPDADLGAGLNLTVVATETGSPAALGGQFKIDGHLL